MQLTYLLRIATLCLLLLTIACFRGSELSAQDRSQWYEFYLPWDDSSRNITNLSGFLDPPAGKYGFLEVTPDGRFQFENSEERVRFVGVVNVAAANYPSKPEAKILADRMARFGINLVRIHLIDVEGSSGLFANSQQNTLDLDTDRLDRMDYFIKCLKDNGIYFNFCIHAGRRYKEADGIDAPVTNYQSKYTTLFNPKLIGLQKDFAERTLTRVNPYTGLSYADDPAMASVELTNENSLFNGWLGWNSDYIFGETGEGIGPHYSGELDSLFNRWLTTNYETDSILEETWSHTSGTGEELILNPSFESDLNGWSTYVRNASGAQATFSIDTDTVLSGSRSLRINSTSTGTEQWHIHVKSNEFSVENGKSYRIRFYAKSDMEKPVRLEIMENQTWYWYGAPEYTPGPAWESFEFYFTCTKTTDQQIIQFEYGTQTGTFWIDSVSVTRFDGVGLEEGESMANGTVRRSRQTEIGKYSPARIGDNAEFYFDLEGAYMDTLTRFLKADLDIKCPVTFTNNYYGLVSIYSQSRSDYMDTHYYWDHPHYPNGWSETDFSLNNQSMMLDPKGSTLNRMPLCRVEGLPLVLSEYNHAYPYIFQSEAPSLLYAYGSFFDLDGIIWHAYYDYHRRFTQRHQDMFFDIAMHPVMMTQMLLSVPYRMGYLEPAGNQVTAYYSGEELFDQTKYYQDDELLNMPPGDYGTSFLNQGFAHGSFDGDTTWLEGNLANTGNSVTSSTGELHWNGNEGYFTVDNPYWQGATGYLSGKSLDLSDISLSGISTTGGHDFAAVHLISMDSLPIRESRNLVLLTSARLENEGFLWNASRTTPSNLGGERALAEPVRGFLEFKFPVPDSSYLFRLDERGSRSDSVKIDPLPDGSTLLFESNTLWYEVQMDSATYSDPTTIASLTGENPGIKSYPNPASSFAWVEYTLSGDQPAELTVLNSSGRILYAKELTAVPGKRERLRLDLTGFGSGLFLVKLAESTGTRHLNRLIKQN